MAALSPILRSVEGNRLAFYCRGCDMVHQITHGPGGGPRWTWNGSVDKPTFRPSVLVQYEHLSEAARARNQAFHAEHGRYMTDVELPYDIHEVCHSFVTDGRIQYLEDCTHKLAGQTIDLPTWDDT